MVDVNEVTANGIGKKLGTISFQDSDKGLIITPALADLPSGTRGFTSMKIHLVPLLLKMENQALL